MIPNSANPSINVFGARGLTMSSLWGSNTYLTSSEMLVTGITGWFRSNCPRGVQNKISLEAAMLCNRSEAFCRETSGERPFGTEESTSRVDSSVPLRHHDQEILD